VMDPRFGYRHLVEADTGLIQPFDFDLPSVRALRKRFELNPCDIVIATYPKCGTTWMQQIVLLLIHGPDAKVNPMRDAPWLEMSCSSAANGCQSSSPPISVDELCSYALPSTERPSQRCWKTHAPAHATPWRGGGAAAAAASGARIIVVFRNSKDTAVSMLHHTRNIPPFGFTGGWEEFSMLFREGRVESNSYWDWYEGWWRAAQEHSEAVLWVVFEDMLADLPREVKRIAHHIGTEPSAAQVAAISARCTFSSMRAESADRDKTAKFVKKDHLRVGQAGGWRKVFSSEDCAAFDEKNAQLLRACEGLRMEQGSNKLFEARS